MKTVKEMYNYSRDNDLKLLSDFDAAFWEEYKLNHARYDKVFSRLYSSFYYIHQEEDFTIDTVQSEFSEDVYNFLLINRKKYEELYRIYNISDDDYKFDNNFSIKTVYSKNFTSSDTSNYGDKTDSISNSESLGVRTDSTSSTQNNSQRTDSYTDVIGTRNDTSSSTQSNSERIDSYKDTIGSVNKTINNKIGSQNNSHVNTVAAYNDETFFNKEKNTDSLGERTDNSTEKTNERNDSGTKTTGASSIENSSSFNSGEQNNSGEKIKGSESIESTLEFTKGNQTNTNSSTIKKGSYVDSASHSSNENYTMEKNGLIGNKTSTSLIKEHENYWKLYEFYNRIFSDICNEFLCI